MVVLIRGGTIVNHDSSRRADVFVRDGVIAAVGTNLDAPTGGQVIDAGGCYVLPGGIDPHTHLELAFMVGEAGEVIVHRVSCALDAVHVVNPGIVEAQMQGAVVYALGAGGSCSRISRTIRRSG